MRLADRPAGARRTSARRRSARRLGAATLVVSGLLSAIAAPVAYGAGTVSTLQARATRIATEVDTLRTKLEILGEEYDQAEGRAGALAGALKTDRAALGSARLSVSKDASDLQEQAVDAYVNAGSSSGFSVALSSNGAVLPVQQTYLSVAAGSLSSAITSLQNSEHELSVRSITLSTAERAAEQAAQTIASSRAAALELDGQLTTTLADVRGQLAAAVAEQEAQERAAAAAAAAATAAAAAQASPTIQSVTGQSGQPDAGLPAPSSSAPGAGAAAVKAAESQLGVPYVWGGATPGEGFDCSGLAMWAWGRAGVSLPHSAEAQYESVEHVPLDQLQPGDLVFYADGGYVYHVVIYIGNGQVVQAEDTGTVIQVTPLWPGAYAAGRP